MALASPRAHVVLPHMFCHCSRIRILLFFVQNSKNVTFYVFCFVAYVFPHNDRHCLLHLEVYQIASFDRLALCTVRSETTNNYIYVQHYIKLLIKIWP